MDEVINDRLHQSFIESDSFCNWFPCLESTVN